MMFLLAQASADPLVGVAVKIFLAIVVAILLIWVVNSAPYPEGTPPVLKWALMAIVVLLLVIYLTRYL